MKTALALSPKRECLVALSGGKDSLVTLDLCARHADRVEAYFMYLVPGLRCFEDFVDAAAQRYGIRVHKVPHFDLARMVKYAICRQHLDPAHTSAMRKVGVRDVENHVRELSGIQTVARGERAADSMVRRHYTSKNDGISVLEYQKFFPIWDWLDADVMAYLRARRIPMPPASKFSRSQRGAGMNLLPETLSWMKREHPADYQRVLERFPYAEAMLVSRGDAQAH